MNFIGISDSNDSDTAEYWASGRGRGHGRTAPLSSAPSVGTLPAEHEAEIVAEEPAAYSIPMSVACPQQPDVHLPSKLQIIL